MSAIKGKPTRPDISTEEIVRRYLAGESSLQLAAAFRCSAVMILDRLQVAGVPRRVTKTVSTAPIGYSGYHWRVRRARGCPKRCEDCGTTTAPGQRYEWANLTGNYADVNDYRRLCKACHIRFDDVGQRVGAMKVGRARPDMAKLTAEIVRSARVRSKCGESASALAREFGVHSETMAAAIAGRTWGHVQA